MYGSVMAVDTAIFYTLYFDKPQRYRSDMKSWNSLSILVSFAPADHMSVHTPRNEECDGSDQAAYPGLGKCDGEHVIRVQATIIAR